MAGRELDRDRLLIRGLRERMNKVEAARDMVPLSQPPSGMSPEGWKLVEKAASRVRRAKENGTSRMLAFGAHTIKNGMSAALISLMKEGWLTHLATNGAGIIHDWEIAFQGKTSEDVRANVREGKFGIWHETGYYLNLALVAGAYEGLGYGESVGSMILHDGLSIPELDSLYETATSEAESNSEKASAAIDFAGVIKRFGLKPGFMEIRHPYKTYSVQAAALELGIPLTGHPMIGHDIIYNHPANHGAAVGRTALRDFLAFAGSVLGIDHGVYMSVGSAVMSPMIFEKALSMAQNIRIREGRPVENHYMLVVDLARSGWDWKTSGEPPADDPAYYLRYCKTFARMGGEMDYLSADNRDFLLALCQTLK